MVHGGYYIVCIRMFSLALRTTGVHAHPPMHHHSCPSRERRSLTTSGARLRALGPCSAMQPSVLGSRLTHEAAVYMVAISSPCHHPGCANVRPSTTTTLSPGPCQSHHREGGKSARMMWYGGTGSLSKRPVHAPQRPANYLA